MRHIVLDTETTGLSRQNDRVVEIAAIEFSFATGKLGDYYHVYLNPEKAMPVNIQRVHGISNAFAARQPLFLEEVAGFVGFIRGANLYIHNAPFDNGMLDAEFSRIGLDPLSSYVNSIVCTLAFARRQFPGQRNTLDALCDRLGVDRSKRTQHGALLDCELLAQVTSALYAIAEGKPLRQEQSVSPGWFKAILARVMRQSQRFV